MNTTAESLLDCLRRPEEPEAWARFVRLYTPLLFLWARRLGLQEQDAGDLVQDVFVTLVQKLPEFRYDPARSFRSWLRTVITNKWRDRGRRHHPAAGVPDDLDNLPAADGPELFEEAEYRRHVVQRALQLMQTDFAPNTWKACWEHVVAGRPAAEVAAELGIAVGSVYVAKSRVLCHLRQELQGLLD